MFVVSFFGLAVDSGRLSGSFGELLWRSLEAGDGR